MNFVYIALSKWKIRIFGKKWTAELEVQKIIHDLYINRLVSIILNFWRKQIEKIFRSSKHIREKLKNSFFSTAAIS